jgi:hypothetical protein
LIDNKDTEKLHKTGLESNQKHKTERLKKLLTYIDIINERYNDYDIPANDDNILVKALHLVKILRNRIIESKTPEEKRIHVQQYFPILSKIRDMSPEIFNIIKFDEYSIGRKKENFTKIFNKPSEIL